MVDVDRNIKPDLEIFHHKMMEFDFITEEKANIEISGIKTIAKYQPVDLKILASKSVQFIELLDKYKAIPEYVNKAKQTRRLYHGPVFDKDIYKLGEMPVIIRKGPPIVINESNNSVTIPINAVTKGFYFIGNAGMGPVYPFGDPAQRKIAEYTVVYDNGEKSVFPIRNGLEICSVFGSYGPSRIDPRASNAPRVINITYDSNWEYFYINAYEAVLPRADKVKSITITLIDKEVALLLYGLTGILE